MFDYTFIVECLNLISEALSFPSLLTFIVLGIVGAFFGYYIFMKTVRVWTALILGGIGYTLALELVPTAGTVLESLPVSFGAVVGIVCAVLGAILAHRIYKSLVYITGAILGFDIGLGIIETAAPALLEGEAIPGIIICSVIGLVFGIIYLKVFKTFFILGTSVCGMTGVGAALGIALFPQEFLYSFKTYIYEFFIAAGASAADVQNAFEYVGLNAITAPTSDIGGLVTLALIAVGLIVGIIAAVKQFRTAKEL